MTSKAKYIGKYVYDRNDVDLEYEYKGETYWVHIHNIEGYEPLVRQHRSEQDRIDKELELREKDNRKKEDYECIKTICDNIDDYLLDMIGFN